jgi:hypothetical protein
LFFFLEIAMAALLSDAGSSDEGEFKGDALAISRGLSSVAQINSNLPLRLGL